jgi:ribosomal protein L19
MCIPFFKKGSILSITLQYYQGSLQNIQGVCIKKKNQGNTSYFSLSCLVQGGTNETVIQTFLLYSPYIKKIQILSKIETNILKL